MKLVIKNYHEVNGYKITRDDGRVGRKRPGAAICKSCGKEFECNIYNLRYNKGCGCINTCPLPKLDKYINGFEILKDLGKPNKGPRRIEFKCKVCGKKSEGQVQNIKTAKSCGCLQPKPFKCSYRKNYPRLFRIYKNMMARCYNQKHKSFPNYGAIGISLCKEWAESPDSFCEWALNSGYRDELSIDRIDVTKGYSAQNCRWATDEQQARNTRYNVLNEETVKAIRNDYSNKLKVKDIVKKYNINRTTVSGVVHNYCWKGV